MAHNGSLLQLVSRGNLDKYLIDDKTYIQESLFVKKIKKITNFSDLIYSSNPINSGSWGDTIKFKIEKVGDLLTNLYFSFELPEISVEDINGVTTSIQDSEYRIKWQEYIGNFVIENIKLSIGGQTIDEHTGEYMQFQTDLYDTTWSKLCMIGHESHIILPTTKIDKQVIYVPLKFFFCNNYTKSLPIYALQHHDVFIEIKLRPWKDIYLVLKTVQDSISDTESRTSKLVFAHTNNTITEKNIKNIKLECNYILLDNNERKFFLSNPHEILITNVQKIEYSIINNQNINIPFNNCIKELYFTLQTNTNINQGELFNYSGKPKYLPVGIDTITETLWNQIPKKHLLKNATLFFDNLPRIPERDYKFWHFVQNYENYRCRLEHNIYLFNFGLDKNENTGSCNFSEINDIILKINFSQATNEIYRRTGETITIGPSSTNKIVIYGVTYNILKIKSGMAGLLFI